MAQVTTRKRGDRWEYRFEMASMDGKRKQKSKGGFRTKAEALKAGNAALAEYNNTGMTQAADCNMSVYDFFEMWYDLTKNYRRANTNKIYKQALSKRIYPYVGSYKMSAVTHTKLQMVVNDLCTKYAKGTVRIATVVLFMGFDYAMREMGIISANPAERLKTFDNPQHNDSRVGLYTPDEILCAADKVKDTPVWYAIMIAAYTGMRIGEICALTWDDVDMSSREIHVTHTQTLLEKQGDHPEATRCTIGNLKTEAGKRIIGFGDGLADILERLKAEQGENETIYGEYYQRNYLDENGRVYTTDRKIKNEIMFLMRKPNGGIVSTGFVHRVLHDRTNGKFKFHNIRHTQATTLIENGVSVKEVQYRLGHVDISTTLNIYAESTKAMHDASVHAIEETWTKRGQNVETITENV